MNKDIKKSAVYLLFCLLMPLTSLADDPQPMGEAEIKVAAKEATKKYASAITCGNDGIKVIDFLTLYPWTDYYGREDAEFVVLWQGDVGCVGGTGTAGVHLASVKIGAGNSVYVDPWNSSPPADFEFYSRAFDGVVANTNDVIVLDAIEYGPDDANCCPSLRVRYTLKRAEDKGWVLHQKQEI